MTRNYAFQIGYIAVLILLVSLLAAKLSVVVNVLGFYSVLEDIPDAQTVV